MLGSDRSDMDRRGRRNGCIKSYLLRPAAGLLCCDRVAIARRAGAILASGHLLLVTPLLAGQDNGYDSSRSAQGCGERDEVKVSLGGDRSRRACGW